MEQIAVAFEEDGVNSAVLDEMKKVGPKLAVVDFCAGSDFSLHAHPLLNLEIFKIMHFGRVVWFMQCYNLFHVAVFGGGSLSQKLWASAGISGCWGLPATLTQF